MVAIERDNPRLKGVLPKDYARPGLDTAWRESALSRRKATPQNLSAAKDNHRLGELISLTAASEGEKTHRSVDLLGHVYDWSGATKTAAGSPRVSAAALINISSPASPAPRARMAAIRAERERLPKAARRVKRRSSILHPVLRRALPRRDARAIQRPHLRSMLRLRRQFACLQAPQSPLRAIRTRYRATRCAVGKIRRISTAASSATSAFTARTNGRGGSAHLVSQSEPAG